MKRLLLLILLFPVLAHGQITDPLDPSFKPAITTTCASYIANAWLTDWNAKVRQDAGTAPTCVNGSTSVGMPWLTIYATQNEFADFQVHFHAPAGGQANLTISAGDFVKSTGPGGNSTISAATGVGEKIIAYREAYMNVSKVTATSTAYYNATGVYPDILIPPVDPYWGQTTNAWPFTVAANKNQSAWIDVLIPPTAPSGWYLGSVTIKSGATTLVTMPVVIGVWQWPAAQGSKMPATPTLRTNISEFQDNALCYAAYLGPTTGSPPPYQTACGAYQDAGGNYGNAQNLTSVDASIMFKDHRYDIGGRQKTYPGSGPYTTYNSTVGVLMTGACAHSGAYCPLLVGSKNTSTQIAILGPGTAQQQFQGWAGNFNTSGWAAYPPSGTQTSTNPVTRLFDYAADEPAANCTSWNNGTARHAYATPAYMPELVTGTYTQASACSALQNVDILVANLKLTQSPLNTTIEPQQPYFDWIAGTNPTNPAGVHREYWSYQACDQTGTCGNVSTGNSTWTMPNVNIDGVPAANRAEEWMTFRLKQTGELYFDPAYCLEPTQLTGCGLPQSNDPWLNNLAFGGSGEGSLMQVGQGTITTATNYMGAGVANAKPLMLPTIRLKHWRDGVQDYEYLNALTVAGQGTFVNTQVSNWITNTFTFDLTGNGLNTARFNVGQAIHALTFSSSGTPTGPIPSTFFGMHVGYGTVPYSTAILSPIIVGAEGKPAGTHWAYLESARGTYNFSNLNNAMNFAASNNVPVFWSYQQEPQWAVTDTSGCTTASDGTVQCPSAPSDLTVSAPCQAPLVGTTTTDCQLKEFTTTLVQRYKSTGIQTGCTAGSPQCNGVIQMYEGWNEPAGLGVGGTLTNAQLVTVSTDFLNTIRANDPNAQVCSPAFSFGTSPTYTTIINNFFSAGGPKTYDCYDFHINETTPEAQIADINAYKTLLTNNGIPANPTIYATEAGRWGDCSAVLSGMTQQAYIARIELLYWSNNIQRHYWFTYGSCVPLTNQPTTQTLNAAGVGYGNVESWMVGATMSTPCSASGTVWTCGLTSPNGQALAVWDTSGNSAFSVPSTYVQYLDLEGGSHPVVGSSVTIGTEPILLKNVINTPWSGIIAPTRAMDWSKAGVEGGIPSATWTQCGPTLTPAAAGADTTVINAALAHTQTGYTACTNNQYILLSGTKASPATFTLNGFIVMQANGVLRGGGPDATFLIMTGPNANGCSGLFADVCFVGQPTSAITSTTFPGGTQSATWTAGYAAGTTQITVTNVGSTGIHANQIINLDQTDDPMSVGPSVCTQHITLNNACVIEGAEGDSRGRNPAMPIGWGARTGTVTISGTTVTRTGGTWPSDGSWNAGGIVMTLYPSTNGTGTAQFVTVAAQTIVTPFDTLTVTAPPSGGNGTYTFNTPTGMATISGISGTTMTSTVGTPFAIDGSLVGQAIHLQQNNTQYLVKVQSVTDATHLVLASPPTPGNGTYGYVQSVRSQIQMVRVIAPLDPACIGGVCTGAGPFTLTIDRPLYAQNWNAAHGPGVWWATSTLEHAGVENLSIDHADHSIQTAAGGFTFFNACNDWVKNVRSIRGIRNHVWFYGGCRNTIRDNYFVESKNAATQSYGIEFYRAGDDLIENNIFQHMPGSIVPDITQGSVIANNFSIDQFVAYVNGGAQAPIITATSQSGTTQTYTFSSGAANLSTCSNFCPISIAGTTNGGGVFNHSNLLYTSIDSTHFSITVPTSATIASASEANALGLISLSVMYPFSQPHGPGDMYNLFEGNIGNEIYSDAFHGPTFFNTFFRNYFAGYESAKKNNTNAFRVDASNGYYNLVGNILGSTGTGQQASYERTNSTGAPNWPIYEWDVGKNETINNVLSSSRSQASSLRWGNCDTISSPTCRFVAGEVPTADAFGYANTVPASQALPISFWAGNTAPVYNQTPQGNVPWPFIGPDVTGGRAIAPDLAVPANMVPGGFAYNNAAETCYLNAPIDPAYPLEMDRGMLLFNGTNCYAAAAVSPTVTLGPGVLAYSQNINTTSSPQTATLTNTSSSIGVTVSAVTVTGNFTLSGGSCPAVPFTLAAGANCTFTVTFSPTATIAYTGTLKVTDNASTGGGIQTVNLTGQGTVPIITWVSPQGGTTYTFGNVAIGTPVNSAPLTLSNTGTGPLNVALTLSNTAQFAIFSNGCPNPLAAGSSCPVVVTFTPTAATSYTGNLIETDSVQSLTANLTLNGSGFIPVPNLVAPWPPIILQ